MPIASAMTAADRDRPAVASVGQFCFWILAFIGLRERG